MATRPFTELLYVWLAQPWAMRYMLVDGQGNYGSVDGDSAAAMRYTECRLRKIGEDMMTDLEKETVDMQNNFDDSLQELHRHAGPYSESFGKWCIWYCRRYGYQYADP